jgi:TonB-dependent SusC/RagA subfamily outer membrane receptor
VFWSTGTAVVLPLGEVVVEGYKTTVKAKSNNATTTVTSKTITDRPNASFLQTLQGQIAGLNIATGSGQPGANTSVLLRGLGSINGNSEPLYVVDGVMMNVDNFRSLNPNDIETVSVLKDAGATAIYGNRGSNGVIVIKTRRADFKSKLKITYSSTTGFTEIQQN